MTLEGLTFLTRRFCETPRTEEAIGCLAGEPWRVPDPYRLCLALRLFSLEWLLLMAELSAHHSDFLLCFRPKKFP